MTPGINISLDAASVQRAFMANLHALTEQEMGSAVNIVAGEASPSSLNVPARRTMRSGPIRSRGARKNAIIAHVQQDHGRDPWHLRDAMPGIKATVQAGITVAGVSVTALRRVGDLMLRAIGENLSKQRNPGGSRFTPLTPAYAKAKQARWGSHPILIASGDLMNGVKVEIERKR